MASGVCHTTITFTTRLKEGKHENRNFELEYSKASRQIGYKKHAAKRSYVESDEKVNKRIRTGKIDHARYEAAFDMEEEFDGATMRQIELLQRGWK